MLLKAPGAPGQAVKTAAPVTSGGSVVGSGVDQSIVSYLLSQDSSGGAGAASTTAANSSGSGSGVPSGVSTKLAKGTAKKSGSTKTGGGGSGGGTTVTGVTNATFDQDILNLEGQIAALQGANSTLGTALTNLETQIGTPGTGGGAGGGYGGGTPYVSTGTPDTSGTSTTGTTSSSSGGFLSSLAGNKTYLIIAAVILGAGGWYFYQRGHGKTFLGKPSGKGMPKAPPARKVGT
jgi:hypothetical protein